MTMNKMEKHCTHGDPVHGTAFQEFRMKWPATLRRKINWAVYQGMNMANTGVISYWLVASDRGPVFRDLHCQLCVSKLKRTSFDSSNLSVYWWYADAWHERTN